MSAVGNSIEYVAPPTIERFMLSDAFVRFILGPVGSGKTTGVMFEVFRRCCEQAPGPDGIRRTRWVIVRNTLSQMKQTILKDVETWFGRFAYFKASENVIQIRIDDVWSDWYLIPLDDPANQQRLLSLQLTGAWINEFIEIDTELVPAIAGRCGRYPSAAQGGASWFGIVGDSNMPNAGSRWHEQLDIDVPEGWEVFVQPGGLAPGAENLNYLTQSAATLKLPFDHPERLDAGRQYYRRLADQSPGWVKRYVHAQYGDDPDGTAVFRESFNRDFHVSRERIVPSQGLPLIIGQDFGRSPCALICQESHRGQLLVLEEVVAENMGLALHVEQGLVPALNREEQYRGKRVVVVGDPAGVAANALTEESCFDFLQRMGFDAYPAPTNDVEPRLQAVEALLSRNVGGKPRILIDGTRCPRLVQALHTKYLYARRKDGETRSYPEKKHPWSDLADALQYVALCVQGGYQDVIRRDMERRNLRRQGGARRGSVPNVPRFTSRAWT
jgi:hypothetical protein